MNDEKNLEDFILNNREDFDGEAPAFDLWDRIEEELASEDDEPDAFETFVATNRDAFDNTTPPPRLEGRIFAELDQEAAAGATTAPPLSISHSAARRRRLLPMMGVAASALILIVAAFLIGNSRGYQTGQQDAVAQAIETINPEFAETERFYQSEINAQFTKVKAVNNDPQLVADLEEIDQATAEIRADLLEVPVSQRAELVEELIHIYRTKLDILLRVQRQLPPPGTSEVPTNTTTNEL